MFDVSQILVQFVLLYLNNVLPVNRYVLRTLSNIYDGFLLRSSAGDVK